MVCPHRHTEQRGQQNEHYRNDDRDFREDIPGSCAEGALTAHSPKGTCQPTSTTALDQHQQNHEQTGENEQDREDPGENR